MKFKISVLFLALVIGLVAFSPDLQSITRIPNKLLVRGAATLQDTLQVDGASTLTGNVSAGGTLAVTGATTADDVTLTGVMSWDDTDSTAVGAQNITPSYSYLQVSPATVLTATLQTGSASDGDLLIVHNLVATATTIVDTTATQGGGNITLNKDDIAIFIFGDGVWVEIASPDNS